MTLEEACNALRVDQGVNDALIESLLNALPNYIEITTGLAAADQSSEPLVATVEGLLLRQWYYADQADDQALSRTIDALLKAISIRVHNA